MYGRWSGGEGAEGAKRDAELREVVEAMEKVEAITAKARSRKNPDSRLWVFLRKLVVRLYLRLRAYVTPCPIALIRQPELI